MKRRIAAALCLFSLCFCVVSCSCGENVIHEIEVKAHGCVDKNTGVVYTFAPMAYEPTAYEKTVFGKDIFDGEYNRVSFANGTLTDASDWLYAKDDGILAYNEKKTLPTFDELEINLVNICIEDRNSIIISTIDKEDEIADLIDMFQNGEPFKYEISGISDSYSIKFVSGKYPIAYSILYVEYEDGTCCVYDRSTGVCRAADYVHETYMEND